MSYFSQFIRLSILVSFISALFLAGCSSSSKSTVGGVLKLETDANFKFVVDKDINPDENKRPSPVFVRFYELKSSTAFNKAEFIDMYEHDSDLLKADLVAKQVLKPFTPGEQRTEHLKLHEETREIGLYVEFSQYRGATYRVVVPVTSNNVRASANSFTVKISGNTISVQKDQ